MPFSFYFCYTSSPGLASAYSDPKHPPRLRMSLFYTIEIIRTNRSSLICHLQHHHSPQSISHSRMFLLLLFHLFSKMNCQVFKVRDYFLCFWAFRHWHMTDSIVYINMRLLFDWHQYSRVIIYHYPACCIQIYIFLEYIWLHIFP